MDSEKLDRLVVLILSEKQVNRLMKHLSREGFHFTIINSTGAIGQEAEICLMVGFQHERMQGLLDIVHKHCHSYRQNIPIGGFLPSEAGSLPLMEVQVGGAVFYMMDVERFEQF